MEISKKTLQRLLGVGASLVCLYWGLNNLKLVGSWLSLLFGLLSPLIVGLCIAYVLNVPMNAIEKRLFKNLGKGKGAVVIEKIKRPISFILALICLLAVIALVIFLLVPELITTVHTIRESLPEFGRKLQAWSAGLLTQMPWLQETFALPDLEWKNLLMEGWNVVKDSAASLVGSTFNIATSVFSGIVNFGLGFVISAYVLLQKENFGRQSVKVLHAFLSDKTAERILYISRLSNKIFTNFLTGQCLEAVILGSMFFVSMLILRFPYALLVAVLIAFTALIPIFGAFIGLTVGVFLMLFNNPIQAFWFIILFLVLQQLEGNFIYPKVVGGSVGLPSLWVLLAVTLGGSLMGIVGMLVMVPICSVLYALFKETVNERLARKEEAARTIALAEGVPKDTPEKL